VSKAKASEDELLVLAGVLNLEPEWLAKQLGSHWYPNRGIGPVPPTDPLVYRLFEASQELDGHHIPHLHFGFQLLRVYLYTAMP